MSKEAMKLALEALEICSVRQEHQWQGLQKMQMAEHALREALAEQKSGIKQVIELYDSPDQPSPATPLREHEPVAWLSRDDARLALWEAINKREFGNPTDDKLILDHLREKGLWIGKYTSPPASKPCKVWDAEGYDALCQELEGWKAKAQRKPLTDEQIEDIWADCPADWDDKINVLTLARAIETAHGIKGDA